jgi:hypothetical protein
VSHYKDKLVLVLLLIMDEKGHNNEDLGVIVGLVRGRVYGIVVENSSELLAMIYIGRINS